MKLKEIQFNYQDVSYDDLLVYVLLVLSEATKGKIDWQEIVISAHQLFPKRFGLPHHESKYPDSAQVDRSILRCRDKRYLSGRRSQGYALTTIGREAAEALRERMESGSSLMSSKIKVHEKSKSGKMVSQVKSSEAYKYYPSNKDKISDYHICSMLLCSLDAPSDVRMRNLRLFEDEAKNGNWSEVLEFLLWVEQAFPHLFDAGDKKRKGMYG